MFIAELLFFGVCFRVLGSKGCFGGCEGQWDLLGIPGQSLGDFFFRTTGSRDGMPLAL